MTFDKYFNLINIRNTLLLGVAYYLSGLIGLDIQSAQAGITPFWPPSGIALAAFIIFGLQLWPGIFIGMIAIAMGAGVPVWIAILAAIGSVFESVIPILIARRYGFNGTLDSLRQLLLFLGIAWGGPLISAGMGTASFVVASSELVIPVQNIFLLWWLGNSFGMILIGTSCLMIYQCAVVKTCNQPKSPMLILVALIATVISLAAFQNMAELNSTLILSLMIPLVVLSSIFFGFAGTLIPVGITTLTMILLSSRFPEEAIRQSPLGILYLDIVVLWIITLTGLIVSTAYREGLQHIKNQWLTTHDGLTGLHNRRYLEQVLQEQCFGIRQHDDDFSLLFLDLNKFKDVNDTAGHLVGDACLAYVAELMEKSTRLSDTLARWGGDEFIILLKDCPPKTALEIANKINQQLMDNPFVHHHHTFSLSFSIGLTSFIQGDTPTQMIERADKASYQAKNSNERVVMSSSSQPASPA